MKAMSHLISCGELTTEFVDLLAKHWIDAAPDDQLKIAEIVRKSPELAIRVGLD